MSWPLSILVAVISAAVGCVVAGFVAMLCVDWYRISSFEGKSGYYVVFIALIGLVAALLIGLATSRVVAGSAHPGFLRALGYSLVIVLGIALVIVVPARLSADVPPRIAGEELLLVVEIRWPPAQATSPAADTAPRSLTLHSVANHVARKSKVGPLWMKDAHRVDGRWIVPGAVEVYTSRGDRLLELEPAPVKGMAFLVPLPAYPRKAQLEWSEWMPRAREGQPPLPDGFTMRFKVLPRSQVVRWQTFGAFEIGTAAQGFHAETVGDGPPVIATSATFRVRYRGAPVIIEGPSDATGGTTMRFDRAESVALLPGAPDGLVMRPATETQSGPYYLVLADGERVRSELIADGAPAILAPLVTNDMARFERGRRLDPILGAVDERAFSESGDYLFDGALLTTRPPRVRRFTSSDDLRLDVNVRPLGLSPDGRRVVRFGFDSGYSGRDLVVTDVETGGSSFVPVDVGRTRVGAVSDLDPAWLQHYYTWVRGDDGVYRLVAKADVTPLPYRGVHSMDGEGYREYRVQPAGSAMEDAIIAWLESEMKATRTPEDVAAYGHQLHIDGKVVHVINNESEHHVSFYMDRDTDTRLVETIGKRFDSVLVSGRYDALFTP
ncbi:MAG: hypothetical protein ABIP93_12495 [Gemmatimonadaceae bacterium]